MMLFHSNNTKATSAKCKSRDHRFVKSWLSDKRFKGWLTKSKDSSAYCKVCPTNIRPKKDALIDHLRTKKHLKAVEDFNALSSTNLICLTSGTGEVISGKILKSLEIYKLNIENLVGIGCQCHGRTTQLCLLEIKGKTTQANTHEIFKEERPFSVETLAEWYNETKIKAFMTFIFPVSSQFITLIAKYNYCWDLCLLIVLASTMPRPIQGYRTWPFLLSPGWDGYTYVDIGQWWDGYGATQEDFNTDSICF
uniref:BED-type domain-containing protein n=1 Tax=Romanomermis culicivorax TaxID=13658 RepID=A0A915IUG9_ROMCU